MVVYWVLLLVAWKNKICLQTISFRKEYLKTLNCVQINDYPIGIVTGNHVIVYKLLVLNRNTWYRVTAQTNEYYKQIKKKRKYNGSLKI